MKVSAEQVVERVFPLFVRNGYEGTSLSALVAASGVSKGALYYHFPDKLALYNACIDRFFTGLLPPDPAGAADEASVSAGAPAAAAPHPDLRQYCRVLCAAYASAIRQVAELCGDPAAYLRFILSVQPLRPDFLRSVAEQGVSSLAALYQALDPAASLPAARKEAQRILAMIEGSGILGVIAGEADLQQRFEETVGAYVDGLYTAMAGQ